MAGTFRVESTFTSSRAVLKYSHGFKLTAPQLRHRPWLQVKSVAHPRSIG
jgi:hypothetical protein